MTTENNTTPLHAYFDSQIASLNLNDAQEFSYFIESKGFAPMNEILVVDTIIQLGGLSCFLAQWRDIAKKGADAGFQGFDNDHDRNKLYQKNRSRIISFAIDASDKADCRTSSFVHSYYQTLNHYQSLDFTVNDIDQRLYNPEHVDHHILINIIAWFVLENLAYSYGEYLEAKTV